MTHCCRYYYDILILSTKDISKKFKGDKITMEYEIVNLPEKQQSESLQELIISHPICARSSAIFGNAFSRKVFSLA